MSDDVVTKLPVKFKAPPNGDGPQLKVIDCFDRKKCGHRFMPGSLQPVTYLIREGETEVECGACGTKVDPMWVLTLMAREETKWMQTRKAYIEEMARLSDRERTKCRHCGKLTKISRN